MKKDYNNKYYLYRFYLLSSLVVIMQSQSNFAFAGESTQSKANTAASSIINKQAQEQTKSAQGAEGSSGSNPNQLRGVDLSQALNSAESAGAASGQQSSGSGFNMAMSGVMAAMGTALVAEGSAAKPTPDWMKISMGGFMLLQSGQALMQSLNQGKTSKANRRAGNDFLSYDSSYDSNNPNSIDSEGSGAGSDPNSPSQANKKGLNSKMGGLTPEAQNILKKIEDAGYKVDLSDGTFTTPDGKSISLSEAKNGSAVESKLGLPPGTYDKGMGIVEDLAKRQGANTEGYGSMDSSGGALSGSSENSNGSLDGHGKKSDSLTRTPASALVAGLTSKYNGENIGVAADDIFLMVTRRYQLKSKQDSFITPEHPERGMLIRPPGDGSKR